jgi:ZIP family zinc transporter
MVDNLVNILLLSGLAGLATGLGGLIVVFKRPGKKMLGFLMGLASGVMITFAFLELLSEAVKISGMFLAASSFALGSLLMFSLDFLLPHRYFSVDETGVVPGKFLKSSIMIAIGISLHNFPEGIAVASGYAYMPRLGLVIAIAIALHNIPEGMAISIPIYMSGATKWASLKLALVSGMIEPLGAFVASLFLGAFRSLVPFGLAFASGVMVFVTLDELLPVAHEHGHEHFTSLGVIMGCIVTFVLLSAL